MFCLIPLYSAAGFTLCFIPICSPITFLNAHCPVTKPYCVHHLSNVFYFLSATESISSSLLHLLPAELIVVQISKVLGIMEGEGLNQEENCHTSLCGTLLSINLFLLERYWATQKRSKTKQNKAILVLWISAGLASFLRWQVL